MQSYLNFGVSGHYRDATRQALRDAGFEVRNPSRIGRLSGIAVLVRSDTDDETRVREIVERMAPDVEERPRTVPTRHLRGYRE